MSYCRHHGCRLETLSELLWLYAEGRKHSALDAAIRLRNNQQLEVRCRHVPRDHRTPFAAGKGVS